MKQFCLHEGERYKLTSYGNGLAYALERKDADGKLCVFVQGDDALAFEMDMHDYWACDRITTNDELCHALWVDSEYGLAATEQ